MTTSPVKLNLGSGFRRREGFINVDQEDGCAPDVTANLVAEPWPWRDESVDEIVFDYALEQMGTKIEDLKFVLQEAFRVCRPGAKVLITASHPRHDFFVNNPACTQRLSPDFFQTLSVGRCMDLITSGQHHDVFAFKWGVNFVVRRLKYLISPQFQEAMESGQISEVQIRERMTFENNICQAFEIDLEVVKTVTPGIPVHSPCV